MAASQEKTESVPVARSTPAEAGASAEGTGNVRVHRPEFAELAPSAAAASGANLSLNHLLDVKVTLTAELGRLVMPISEILKLAPGSVVEMRRQVADPVDLYVQGVRFARGEIVVVGDHFAIRILEIEEANRPAH
jgi:flagellar motor switch protein FliN/FliY